MSLVLPLLLAVGAAQADAGRVLAGATFGGSPDHGFNLRGSLDYGATPHLAFTAELGNMPGHAAASMGLGVLAAPLDGQWWRVSIVAIPELNVPITLPAWTGADVARASEPLPGWPTGLLDTTLSARTGLRVNWLVFWGLTFTGRADWSQPLDGSRGHAEIAGGLSIRL